MAMKNIFVSFALAGLLVVGLFTFIAEMQTQNDIDDTILNDPILNKTIVDLTGKLGEYQTKADNQSENQDNDNPLTEGGSLLFISITKTGKVAKGMISGVYNVIVVIPSKLLRVPELAIVVINAIVSMILIFAAWRLYKAGE